MGDTRLDFLAKEPVTGELLSAKLAGGPLSTEEAVRCAIGIGSALHRIHSRGLVHGALSPHCVALEAGGPRILEPSPSPEDCAAYRSPEQVRGEAPDVRSDVFAWGALVFEIVCGKRAFPGEGAELSQRILLQPPSDMPSGTPVLLALEGVVTGCLQKDPAQRRQRVQNAVTELKLAARSLPRNAEVPARMAIVRPVRAPLPAPPHARPASDNRPPQFQHAAAAVRATSPAVAPYSAQNVKASYGLSLKRRVWVIGAGILVLAASSVAAVMLLQRRPAPPVLKFAVMQPENTSYPGMSSVSPDGRYLTFSAVGPEGKRMLWLRPLDALHATVIQGSEGASAPFWSPDSQEIAFFGGKFLRKVKIAGGAPVNICQAEAAPGGGTWNRDGVILFAPSLSDGFYRVAAAGGKPEPVIKLNESKFERADLWPQFLPDGKHFVFYQQTESTDTSGVYVGSLDQPEYHRLFASQTNAVYSAASPDTPKSGYLLYIHERNLMAQQFNAGKAEIVEEPVTLANDIGAVNSLALAPISVSATGVLVYQGVGQPTRQMVWMDRAGKQIAIAGEPGTWGPPRVSPDGNRAVVAKTASDGKIAHLWLLDISGVAEQISDGPMHEGSPVWSPDGSHIAHFGRQGDAYDIFTRPVLPGSHAELVLKNADKKFPSDWSHDGKYITYSVEGAGTRLDMWGVTLADHKAAPILDTVYAEGFATVSPDGKWVAYQSDQTGRNEVYVQAFDGLNNGTKRRWMISTKGGGLPRWRFDSSELFYMMTDGRVMSVPLHPSADGGIEAAPPQMLFQTRPVPKTWNLYDVSPDGQHFALNIPLEWTSAAPITVITNWTEKLKQ